MADWVVDTAESFAAIGTLALAGATVFLAFQSRRSNEEAERLYALQRLEIERRERTSKPNLQLFDQRQEDSQRVVPLNERAVWIELMNFGSRPARINNARLTIEGSAEPLVAECRDSSCVRHNELVRFEVRHAMNLWIGSAVDSAANADRSGSEVDAGDLGRAQLEITYTEVDGFDSQTITLPVDLTVYRSVYTQNDFFFTIVR